MDGDDMDPDMLPLPLRSPPGMPPPTPPPAPMGRPQSPSRGGGLPSHSEVELTKLPPPRNSAIRSSSSSRVRLGPSARPRCCASRERTVVSGAAERLGRSTENLCVKL